MEFRKTTVLPLDKPQEAERLFRHYVYDQPHVLFVVVGSGPKCEALVSKAGMFAGIESEPRKVIWMRDLDSLRQSLEGLKEKTPGMKSTVLSGGALAFVLSLGDEIRDVITSQETVDNVRVNLAFLRAEVVQ